MNGHNSETSDMMQRLHKQLRGSDQRGPRQRTTNIVTQSAGRTVTCESCWIMSAPVHQALCFNPGKNIKHDWLSERGRNVRAHFKAGSDRCVFTTDQSIKVKQHTHKNTHRHKWPGSLSEGLHWFVPSGAVKGSGGWYSGGKTTPWLLCSNEEI